jgi:undecaprenyl-diphosphatase
MQGATPFFTVMTLIGTPAGLGVLVTIIAAILAMGGRWRWAAYFFLTSTIGGLLNLQLKSYFARARPELAEALRDAHGYSFPSGHAMGSTVVFGALCYLAFRVIHTWRWRAVVLALNCSMIAAIATSRIYLGVHWISDIAAGIAAGLIWLTATTVAYETSRRIRLLRSMRAKRKTPA